MFKKLIRHFSWPERQQRRTERFMRRRFDSVCPGGKMETPNYIVAYFPGRYGGIISMNGIAKTDRITLWTEIEIVKLDERLGLPLCRLLLKRNVEQQVGAYGLHNSRQGLSIVQTLDRHIDSATPLEWNGYLQALLTQCQNLVYQLYSEGFINRISDWGTDYDTARGYAGR